MFLKSFTFHGIDIGNNFERRTQLHVHGDHHVFLTQEHQRLTVNLLRHK